MVRLGRRAPRRPVLHLARRGRHALGHADGGARAGPARGWLGRHRHEATEVYVVTGGEGVVHLDGQEVPVRAGSMVYLPSGCLHGLRSTGEETLTVAYVYAADSADDERTRYSYPSDAPGTPGPATGPATGPADPSGR
ncbi:cupin domain-containing protein [Pseudokineococcus sp. 1T1Z-3]|uniref:cupin domain-containing protein n=1 Tax=Pseudokineococcus sp. 1T1Z-3 TaxID=3132745 RepID=UPI0030B3603B